MGGVTKISLNIFVIKKEIAMGLKNNKIDI